MADTYDVIIIGTGAGGGTLALDLAPSGKSILLLERGGWLPREKENWSAEDVFVDHRYVSKETWVDKAGAPFQPGVHYFVGGATKMYGAALYRQRERDFGELRHEDGVSPAWPISYAEIEPYYTRAENLYQVHGARGEDPTEPPTSAPYPCPAVSHEPRIQQLHDDLLRAGYHPFHSPCGILLDEGNRAFSACVRCPDCDGFPCLVHAKADAEVIAVRPALRFPNVTLLTNARATRLMTNETGTAVTEVVVDHEGAIEAYRGGIVVVSCGAANSARLLLASANDKHLRGLANGSDQVGRNYMCHNSTAVLAISKEPNPTQYQKTLGLSDFYFDAPEYDFPLGSVQMMGKSQAPMLRGEAEIAKLAPSWSLDLLARHASVHFASFFLGLEILSVSLYALIGYRAFERMGVEASFKYLVLAGASAAFLLFGFALIYAELGTLTFGSLASLATTGSRLRPAIWLTGLALIVTGVGFKLALVPFHLWTPDVYQGAPAPVTAFVATASKSAVFAVLLRMLIQMHAYALPSLVLAISLIAGLSMFVGNLLALLQTNIKRILAYSSIAHLGYLLVALLSRGALAIEAVGYYLATYVLTMLVAFGVVAVLSSGGREAEDLDDYRALFWRRPWLAAALTIAVLSLAAIPLTGGFVGKFYIVAAGAASSLWALLLVLAVNSAIGLFYYLRIIVVMYSTPVETAAAGKAPVRLPSRVALFGLVTAILCLGLYPAPLVRLLRRGSTTILPTVAALTR